MFNMDRYNCIYEWVGGARSQWMQVCSDTKVNSLQQEISDIQENE